MANENLGFCDCPICGQDAHVRESKKFKAYIVCGECGFQGFARGVIANAKLRLKIRNVTPAADPLTVVTVKPAIAAPVVPVVTIKPAVKPGNKAPVIRRHTSEGENVPGVEVVPPPAKELTIFDKDFWKGGNNAD